ncbi:AMP-binding protein [Corynebacterium guangdongense]|uniref:Fatty-acyl-CoA synthase n=1 Tax=Corynebacterium guangdongense TaxID=1783348 RepID=A0ABU2A0X9_9CORY|nr:AMP-binding protein [Corynebacterium guangdongense]MDR7330839.1 fatty-acyl-CoA synthase [Corynebacterium guangdongense]WJZ16854.1 Long-chain-fatty-acid--CoA ligase [Corynebacterium guangdongense]
MPPALADVAFNAKAMAKFLPAVLKSGIVDPTAGVKSGLATLPILARYHFTLARELEQAYATCPDRIALIDDDGTLTYRQFRDQARTIARWLQSLGLEEIHMGIMARNGRGILLPMAAKGYVGATMYLLNVGSSPEQLAGSLAENDMNVLFVDDEFLDRVPRDYPGLTVVVAHDSRGDHEDLTTERIVRNPKAVTDQKLPVFPKHGDIVLMSSGTTGIPKGVVRPEPKLPFVVAGVLENVPIHADMRTQMTASMFHTWGWSMTNICIAARHTIITQRVFDAENCLRQIEKYQATALVSSPIFYKQMMQVPGHEEYDTSSLELLASSGHALTPEIVKHTIERFGPILCNIYGSTELTLAAGASAAEIAADPTISGRVASGTRLKILDEQGREVPRGQVGRIYLHNSTSLTGYTNPDIPIERARDLIAIGDLGYLDEDSYLHVLGRADDMIIVGGENVYPKSVEEVLEAMPGVSDLAATGVDDEVTFKRIAVWIVREDSPAGESLSAESVRQWVRDNLADHSVPRDVRFVEELPRNATGKVMARFLPTG